MDSVRSTMRSYPLVRADSTAHRSSISASLPQTASLPDRIERSAESLGARVAYAARGAFDFLIGDDLGSVFGSEKIPKQRVFGTLSYLHQDYDDEHGSADAAIDAFVSEMTSADRSSFGTEVELLLRSNDEAAIARKLDAMGNFYDYERDAVTARQWIQRIAERITGGTSKH